MLCCSSLTPQQQLCPVRAGTAGVSADMPYSAALRASVPTSGCDDRSPPPVGKVGAQDVRPLSTPWAPTVPPLVRATQRLHDAVAVHEQLEALRKTRSHRSICTTSSQTLRIKKGQPKHIGLASNITSSNCHNWICTLTADAAKREHVAPSPRPAPVLCLNPSSHGQQHPLHVR